MRRSILHYFLSVLLTILSIQIGTAQCEPVHPLSQSSCELAVENLLCDVNQLNDTECFVGSQNANPSPLQVQCGADIIEMEAPHYFAFMNGWSEIISFDILFENCTNGSGPDLGVEAALFEYDYGSQCIGDLITCGSLCEFPQESFSLFTEILQPHTIYILVIDMCGTSTCDVSVVVNDGVPAYDISNLDYELSCISVNCDYSINSDPIIMAGENLDFYNIENFVWELIYADGTIETIQSSFPEIDLPISTCIPFTLKLVEVSNHCFTYNPNTTLFIDPTPDDLQYSVSKTILNSGESFFIEFSNLSNDEYVIITPIENLNIEGAFSQTINPPSTFYLATLNNLSDTDQIQQFEIAYYYKNCDPIVYLVDITVKKEVSGTIGGRVWEEDIEDCMFDSEFGISDVTLELVDEAGDIVSQTVTDSMGNFTFTGINDGTYTVQIRLRNTTMNKALAGAEICPKYVDATIKELNDNNGKINSDGNITTTSFTYDSAVNSSDNTLGFAFRLNCNKIGKLQCEEAFNDPVFNLLSIRDCYKEMPTFQNPVLPPEFHCEPNNAFQNVTFTSFYSGQGDYEINISFEECFNTNPTGIVPTIQLGLYQATCGLPEYIVCESNLEINNNQLTYTISSDMLTPKTKYMLWIDGFDGAVCSYNIYIEGNYEPYDYYKIEQLLVNGAPLNNTPEFCNVNEYTFTAQNATYDLKDEDVIKTWWTIDYTPFNIKQNLESNSLSLDYYPTESGNYLVTIDSVELINGCVLYPNVTAELGIYFIEDEDFGVVTLCKESLEMYTGPTSINDEGIVFDPNADGTLGWVYEGIPLKEGFNEQIVSGANGCSYTQYVEIILYDSPIITLNGPAIIKPGDVTFVSSTVSGTYISSSPSIISIDNSGVVTGISEGCAEVQLTDAETGCKSNLIQICVVADTTRPILIDRSFCIGETSQIMNYEDYQFTIADTDIIEINATGAITALSAGTTIINVSGSIGYTDAWTIVVNPAPQYNIMTNDTIRVGETLFISSNPATWSSSNPSIASINDDGLVTGISPGMVQFTLTDAVTGCSNITTAITVLPAITEFILCGTAYIDTNENGIRDAGENGLPDFKIIHPVSNMTYFTDNLGDYSFEVEKSSVSLSAESTYGIWKNPAIDTTVDVSDAKTVVNFGFIEADSSMTYDIDVNTTLLRCNTFALLQLFVTNRGNYSAGATVKLIVDPTVTTITFDPQPIAIVNNEYTFDITDLAVGEQFSPYIRIGVPPFFPSQDSMTFGIEVYEENGELSATKVYTDVIRCSYDPNDKRVFPDRPGEENFILRGEELEYIIRFQNNGNDTAFYVEIQDVIDPKLDIDQLLIRESSHDVEVLIHYDTVFFIFNEIALVDSATHYVASQGFVSFTIPAREDLNVGDIIYNDAAIIFDKNEPIYTNQTMNTITDFLACYDIGYGLNLSEDTIFADTGGLMYSWFHCEEAEVLHQSADNYFLPTETGYYQAIIEGNNCRNTTECIQYTISASGDLPAELIEIYPNPSTGMFHLKLDTGVKIHSIIDIHGKTISNVPYTSQTLDMTNATSGVYFLSVGNEYNSKIYKVVKI